MSKTFIRKAATKDILCHGGMCPVKERCLLNNMEPNTSQYFFLLPPFYGNEKTFSCEVFLPIEEKRDG